MGKTTKEKSISREIKMALDGRPQRWLGQKIGMMDADLSNKLNGIRNFTQEELDKINEILGLSLTC